MRRHAFLAVLALAGCSREPNLMDAPDRAQLAQGRKCVVVSSGDVDAFWQGDRTGFGLIAPTSHVVVISDPIEKDLAKMTDRHVRVHVVDGPRADETGTVYRYALRAED